jgi:hypothetical protein
MTAYLPHSLLARWIIALAITFAVAAGFAARPAAADGTQWGGSQWAQAQPHWWDNSNGWRRHMQWDNQWRHQRHHFNGPHVNGGHFDGGSHRCFGSCFVGNGPFVFHSPGVIFTNPSLAFGVPAFIVQQPGFIVRQPAFIVRQPTIIVGGPVIVTGIRPHFVARHRAFDARHPSLQPFQPTHGPVFIRPGESSGGIRIIRPGM